MSLRVAVSQADYRVGDLAGNLARVLGAHEWADRAGADLLVCSELALSGYPPRDMLTRERFVEAHREALSTVADATADGPPVLLGAFDRSPDDRGKPLRNLAVLCADGRVRDRVAKRLLPTYDVFDEDRYFAAGDRPGTVEVAGHVLGVTVCEDAWSRPDVWERPLYEVDPVAEVAPEADLLVNVSASPFHAGKGDFRDELVADHARDHDCPFVLANQVGATDDVVFDGRSLVVDADGDPAVRLGEFAPDRAVCEVAADGSVRPVRVEVDLPAGEADRSWEPAADERTVAGGAGPVAPATDEVDAVRLAVETAIRDYVHKSGFEGVIVGLSGGIDSSVTATLAARALGPEAVLGVAMPARYTSSESTEDARRLAENLGVEFRVVPVEETFTAAMATTGVDGGLAEENLQSRLRGTLLMALSNERGDLVLSPDNKSELAVGYSTLYGDTVGALMPIGDCYKHRVYDLARRCNDLADRAVIPRRVIEKPPSAELRPDQRDADDLPPYDVLDPLLADYLDRGLSPDRLVEAGHDPAVVEEVLERVHRAEYKRWQAPPVPKVTPKTFATGWRYPLAADRRALRRSRTPAPAED